MSASSAAEQRGAGSMSPVVPLALWPAIIRCCRAALASHLFLRLLLVFLGYYIAGKLGQATTNIRSGNLGPVWPASGVALAAILAGGYRVWPGLFAGCCVVAYQSPVAAMTAAGQAAGATLAAVAGAFAMRRIGPFDPTLPRLRDAIALIVLGAFAGGMVSATIGVISLHATNLEPYSGLASAWLIYWLGDATGVLLVTPLLFTLPALFDLRSRRRAIELVVLLLVLVTTCFVVFGDLPLVPIRLHVLAFAVLPLVMWAAISFGVGGAALSVFLIATAATLLTAFGFGPFSTQTPFVNAVLLDVLFAVLAVSGLALGAVITERERAERDREELIRSRSAVETRLRLAAIVESSNDAILSTTPDGVILSWNAAAQRMFGFTEHEMLGRKKAILVPSGLQEEYRRVLQRVKADAPVAPYETRRLTKDGRTLDVLVTASPIHSADGRVLGVATIIRDIADQKAAEQALSTVSRRLVDAQEQERRRIGRELHDDIGQRLALLSAQLAATADEEASAPSLRSHILDLQQQTAEIATDLQGLSHQLHSSRLDLLGVTAATRHFCEEFAAQQRVSVTFDADPLPAQVPGDISLCVFRIVQEALHNGAKHSGAGAFSVSLRLRDNQIHLTITDHGRGFDVAVAKTGRGLGLVSMEERVKLVGGELTIDAQPHRGATVHVRLPLPPSAPPDAA